MKRVVLVWSLWLFALGFALPGRGSLSPHAVEVLFLFDNSAIESEADLRKARKVCGNLFNSLPLGTLARVRQVGERSDLESCSRLAASSSESSPASLQLALLEAESILCSVPAQSPYCSTRRAALVVVGGGGEPQPLQLSGACRVTVFAVGVTGKDLPLQRLAEETKGRFVPLSRARGYAVAQFVRAKVWIPAVRNALEAALEDTEEPGNLSTGLILVIVLALTLIRNRIRHRGEIASKDAAAPQAGLTVLSGRGAGADFKVPAEGTLLLGCAGGPARSAANLLFDDRFVAVEHCEIREEQGEFVLIDLSGGWRTLVNQEEVQDRRMLRSGDRVQVGNTLFQFRLYPS